MVWNTEGFSVSELLAPEIHDKCAVAGASTSNSEINVTEQVFLALDALQHRGDAGSGLVALTFDGKFDFHRGAGLVKDVYTTEDLEQLAGTSAIGNNRYPTSGKGFHPQPVILDDVKLALGMNGTLSVTDELESFLSASNIHVDDDNDTEMITYGLAQFMRQGMELPDAVERIFPLLKGAFSIVAQHREMVVAFRDHLGIRPYSLAEIQDGFMVSSETCGFYPSHAKFVRDVVPGEMIVMTKGDMESRQIAEPNPKRDIFEDVYFSRIDSEQGGESVGQRRYRMGQELAQQYPLEGDNYLVVGVPESALPIAEGYANTTGLEKRDVLVKHRFRGGRSFQQATQKQRRQYLERKFSYVSGVADNRDVILVDDSIVRLNTARVVKNLLMRAGAKSVTFLVGSPPIGYPDFSGIDTPKQNKLIASHLTPEQIRQKIGCKGLGYLALSRLIRATGQPADVFNLASFTGKYPYEIGSHDKHIRDSVSLDYLENASAMG